MSHVDRRSPHITVQQLRRDLREADEDRFRLSSTLGPRTPGGVPSTPRIVGLLVLIASAFGSAFWTTRAPALTAETPSVVEAASVSPELAAGVQTPVVDAPVVRASGGARPSAAKPAPRRSPRSAIRLRDPIEPTPVRPRAAPRPLHPGEFGRRPLAE